LFETIPGGWLAGWVVMSLAKNIPKIVATFVYASSQIAGATAMQLNILFRPGLLLQIKPGSMSEIEPGSKCMILLVH
jgi:hypothetical protein